MVNVNIKITSLYLRDGTFKWYNVESMIRKSGSGFDRNSESLEDIAKEVLKDVAYEKGKPIYKINLWEGWHPLRKCDSDDTYPGFTQKPPKKVRKELTDYLHDPEMIAEARDIVKKHRKNPPGITIIY